VSNTPRVSLRLRASPEDGKHVVVYAGQWVMRLCCGCVAAESHTLLNPNTIFAETYTLEWNRNFERKLHYLCLLAIEILL